MKYSNLISKSICLTHKQMETHGCVLNTVAADALVPKRQVISINSAGLIMLIFVVLDHAVSYRNITVIDQIALNSLRPSDELTIIGSDNGLSPARRPMLNQCWNIVNWTLRNKLQWNLNRNSYVFIQENAFEIGSHLSVSASVCKLTSIEVWTKWTLCCRCHFKSISSMKVFQFHYNFNEVRL